MTSEEIQAPDVPTQLALDGDFITETVRQFHERRDALTARIAELTQVKAETMAEIKALRAERTMLERLMRATLPRGSKL